MNNESTRRRITKGHLEVPFTEVSLSNGEVLELYDTAGPPTRVPIQVCQSGVQNGFGNANPAATPASLNCTTPGGVK